MRIRTGFVSNSSSASFVIKFGLDSETTEDFVDRCITESDVWLKKKWFATKRQKNDFSWLRRMKKGKHKERKPVYEKCPTEKSLKLSKEGDVYSLSLDTTMFNDWSDVPGYRFVWALSENRIKGINMVELRQTEEEYNDCNDIVVFAPEPWEMLERDYKIGTAEADEARAKYAEQKYAFLYYLNNLGQEIKPEEHLDFIKDCLMFGVPKDYVPYKAD
jgi:hypothetical protein